MKLNRSLRSNKQPDKNQVNDREGEKHRGDRAEEKMAKSDQTKSDFNHNSVPDQVLVPPRVTGNRDKSEGENDHQQRR